MTDRRWSLAPVCLLVPCQHLVTIKQEAFAGLVAGDGSRSGPLVDKGAWNPQQHAVSGTVRNGDAALLRSE